MAAREGRIVQLSDAQIVGTVHRGDEMCHEFSFKTCAEEQDALSVNGVLLGDSTIDNKGWVGREALSVSELLRFKLHARGKAWAVRKLAVDGALVGAVYGQLARSNGHGSHAVLSVGGNNGLGFLGEVQSSGMLSPAAFLRVLRKIDTEFRHDYCAMLDCVLAAYPRTVACGIYRPRFDETRLAPEVVILAGQGPLACFVNRFTNSLIRCWTTVIIAVGVSALNHVIKGSCLKRRVPFVDLQAVFDSDRDYANPIEPSVYGGDKISENIIHVLSEHDFSGPGRIYAVNQNSQELGAIFQKMSSCSEEESTIQAGELAPEQKWNRSRQNATYRKKA